MRNQLRQFLTKMLLVCMLCMFMPIIALANDVEEVTPNNDDGIYEIETAAQLAWIAQQVNTGADNFGSKTIKLMNDISLNEYNWQPIGTVDETAPDNPVSHPFNGTFDGNGHRISDMSVTGNGNYQGLFGYVGNIGLIQNIAELKGRVTGQDYVGGVAGYNEGTIINVVVKNGTATGTENVGGIAGYNSGQIINAANDGFTVNGNTNIGGVIGHNAGGSITNVYNTGTVNGTGDNVGGIVGLQDGLGSSLTYSYWLKVDGSTLDDIGKNDNGADIDNASFDSDGRLVNNTSLLEMLNAGIKLHNSNFSTQHFAAPWTTAGGYPILDIDQLDWSFVADGTGFDYEQHDTFNITTLQQLAWVANQVKAGNTFAGKTVIIGVDMDMRALEWIPIGTNQNSHAFQGTMDGGGKKIINLYAIKSNNNSPQGLFAYLGEQAVVHDLSIQGYFEGNQNVGSIAGENFGTILNIDSNGIVSGDSFLGGLVGNNRGNIINSRADVQVRGNSSIGGIAGSNSGQINTVLFVGTLDTTSTKGGIAGSSDSDATITHAYWLGNFADSAIGDVTDDKTGAFFIDMELADGTLLVDALNAGTATYNSITPTPQPIAYFWEMAGIEVNTYPVFTLKTSIVSTDVNLPTLTLEYGERYDALDPSYFTYTLSGYGEAFAVDYLAPDSWETGNHTIIAILSNTTHQLSAETSLTINAANNNNNNGSNNGSNGGSNGGSNEESNDDNKVNSGENLTTEQLDDLVEENKDLIMEGDDEQQVIIDSEALADLLEAAEGKELELSLEDVANEDLTEGQKETIGDNPSFELKADIDGENLDSLAKGEMEVVLPYDLPEDKEVEDLLIYRVDQDGNILETYEPSYDEESESLIFETSDFGLYTIGYEPEAEAPTTMSFDDIDENDWFYLAVLYVYQNGIMNGTSATTFDPQATGSRAMMWMVLARLDQADTATVDGDIWYQKALEWAIANGISDGTMPDGSISREQFVTMLYRYHATESELGDSSLGQYQDSDQISDWAITAMEWAIANGIIQGKTANTLEPQGIASRAELATMLMRYLNLEEN